MVPFIEMGRGRDRKGLGREKKHFTLLRLVEIPLNIQVEDTGRPRIYKCGGQSWRANTGKSLDGFHETGVPRGRMWRENLFSKEP